MYNWWDTNLLIVHVWIMKYSYTIYRYDILSLVKPFKIRHRDQLREHPSWEHKGSAAFSEALSELYHPAPNPATYYHFRSWQAEQTDPPKKKIVCAPFSARNSWQVLNFLDIFKISGCNAPAVHYQFLRSKHLPVVLVALARPTEMPGKMENCWKPLRPDGSELASRKFLGHQAQRQSCSTAAFSKESFFFCHDTLRKAWRLALWNLQVTQNQWFEDVLVYIYII